MVRWPMRTVPSFHLEPAASAALPRPPRQRREALAALGGGLGAVVVAGLALVEVAGFAPVVVLAAAGAFTVLAAVVLTRVERFHPHAGFGAANRITVARAALNCVLVGLVADPATVAATWTDGLGWAVIALTLLSLTLDGADGYAARRTGATSRFGARFDVEVDALLLVALAALAFLLDKAGAWVLASGGLYYAFLAARRLWPRLAHALPPALWRKALFVVQAAALIVVALPVVEPPVSGAIAATALTLLVCGFAVDLRWLLRHAPR
jgi:phosphatidylglycerophosphate synthase